MSNSLERFPNQENSEQKPRIVLHFFRHGEADRDSRKSNEDFELTDRGKRQAIEKKADLGTKNSFDQSVAFGSPRKRSQQTAALVMGAEQEGLFTGDENYQEAIDKIDRDIKVGSKMGVDPRLDFNFEPGSSMAVEAQKVIESGGNYLQFLVEDSDRLAKETSDTNSLTFSRQARNVAEIVLKYSKASSRWNEIVAKGGQQSAELERFLGSHGGVIESFLLKVIHKTRGIEERDRLISILEDGFDYTEGFDVIISNNNQAGVVVRYQHGTQEEPTEYYQFEESVPVETIEAIVKEGK